MRCSPRSWLLVLAFVAAHASAQTVRYVDASANGAANGVSWTDAFALLQSALAAANSGDEIRVAAGKYLPTSTLDRNASFVLKPGVILRGGYAGLVSSDPDERNPALHPTILSGDLGQPAVSTDNSFHVVTGSAIGASAILDAFEIADGNADAPAPNDSGAGLLLSSGSPTLLNLIIRDNHAAGTGAGFHASGLAAPAFSNCIFTNNSAGNSGGGGFCLFTSPIFSDCLFSSNIALSGGGLASFISNLSLADCQFASNSCELTGGAAYFSSGAPSLSDCLFVDNVAVNNSNAANDGGGAIYLSSADAVIRRCRFIANLTSDDGGAIFTDGSTPDFLDCVFLGNTAADNGGAIFGKNRGGQLSDCAFSGNDAFDAGGAIYELGGAPALSHCTISRNFSNALMSAGGIFAVNANLSLSDSILWNNSAPGGMTESAQLRASGGSLQVNYSCIMNWTGALGGAGNIAAPPAFVSALGPDGVAGTIDDDLHLAASSPCIDRGNAAFAPEPNEADLDGQPRIMGCNVDIGADERTLGPPGSADFDGNSLVNGADVQPFLAALFDSGPSRHRCIADLNADSLVDNADLALFLDRLLAPPP